MKKHNPKLAIILLIIFLNQLFFPCYVYALTGGPSQPEVQSFEPIATTDMVDVFSGDFNYNIPLLDVGGYPINISYHSGISMDQEASWTGLGWNINPGVILRNMRGLPDDFNGDPVTKEFNIKPNKTFGLNISPESELFGFKFGQLSYSLGISWNNYNGIAMEQSLNLGIQAASSSKGSITCGLGLTSSSENGASVNPSVSFTKKTEDKVNRATKVTGRIGLPFNSRGGLSALTISTSVDKALVKNGAWKGGNNDKFTNVANGGSPISFGYPTHSPGSSRPMTSSNLSFSSTIGGELFGGHLNGEIRGYYATQYLATKSQSLKAYGYMNLQYGQNMDEGDESNGTYNPSLGKIMDFNREKEGNFSEHTPALPLTNLTYDIYSVSGQGIGGTYRPFRSDYGSVFDNRVENNSSNIEFPGIEIGFGNTAHPGLNFSVSSTVSSSGPWHEDNNALENLKFRDYGNKGDKLFEPFYFKQAGEKIPESDPLFFEKAGGFVPVRFAFDKSNKDMVLLNVLLKGDASLSAIGTKGQAFDKENFRKARAKRNEAIMPLTAKEASKVGLLKDIEVYQRNNFALADGSFPRSFLKREEFPRKPHHISEISTYRADGARYIYGIPASNSVQKEVTFAIVNAQMQARNSEQIINCGKGLVKYSSSGKHPDNSVENKQGMDNFFESTETPSYPHSYLLTAVLSSDYVDVDGDGPSANDLGNYTKINYFMATNNKTGAAKSTTYKWRVPFEENMASHNEGFKSLDLSDEFNDDKANYVYGEKELWYVHSIENKNFIAVFYTSDRNDGFGVKDENGGFYADMAQHVRMQKLDSIVLYSRQDVSFNGIKTGPNDNLGKAIPIKTVHFEYDYSLCKGISNFQGSQVDRGKLTLKKIYFTNGYSKREQFSPYIFNYGEVVLPNGTVRVFNPNYHIKGYDRWGNFKGIKSTGSCDQSNSEFPYTDQIKLNSTSETYSSFDKSEYESLNPNLADLYSYAWNLTSVKLPSGGIIKVTYESDDYGYVQDKRAMEMVEIYGALQGSDLDFDLNHNATKKNSSNLNLLYGSDPFHDAKNYLVFKLKNPVASNVTNSRAIITNQYFRDQTNQIPDLLYFRFLVNLVGNKQEFVPGYVKIKKEGGQAKCGFFRPNNFSSGDYVYGYIEIEPTEGPLNREYQSIAVAALNFIKLNLPRLAYESPSRNDDGILQFLKALEKSITNVTELFTSYLATMQRNNFAKTFIPEKSIIRLYSSSNKKKGGGSRVKKLVMNDQWKELTGQSAYSNSEYGQVYDYTTTIEDLNNPGNKKEISSGVASYEPMLGGEENPFRQPDYYELEKLLAPDESHYMEFPYGESFFPSPSVGYSKVTVKNLQYENVIGNATGKVVHEFYTAKDFPTLVFMTPLDANRHIPPKILKFLWCDYKDYVTASQGYSIELNDMHGKPKAQWVYQEGKSSPISGIEYKYKQSSPNRLDNNFTVIHKDGTVGASQVGVDHDFVVDLRQEHSKTISGGLGGNLDAFLAVIFPAAIPTIFPSYSQEETQFRSSVVTKVINRYGILETTIAYDLGANVATTNLALDAATGEVLLTKTTNQFNDSIYNLTLPAHFAYEGMGQSFANLGLYGHSKSDFLSNLDKMVDGDEIILETKEKSEKVWFLKTAVAPFFNLLNINGNYIGNEVLNDLIFFKLINSGRKNRQNEPIGKYVMNQNPIKNQLGRHILEISQGIINAEVTEYSGNWNIDCGCQSSEEVFFIYNPFLSGKLGTWRPSKAWKFLTDRTQTNRNNNTNIRKDGIYQDFNNFWVYDKISKGWIKSNAAKWQYSSEISLIHPSGFEAENKDALGRYSAATFGYNYSLPTAVGANGKYSDIAFDGFEDYYFYLSCPNSQFSFSSVVTKGTGAGAPPAESNTMLVNTTAHSGRYSVKVKHQQAATINKKVSKPCN